MVATVLHAATGCAFAFYTIFFIIIIMLLCIYIIITIIIRIVSIIIFYYIENHHETMPRRRLLSPPPRKHSYRMFQTVGIFVQPSGKYTIPCSMKNLTIMQALEGTSSTVGLV